MKCEKGAVLYECSQQAILVNGKRHTLFIAEMAMHTTVFVAEKSNRKKQRLATHLTLQTSGLWRRMARMETVIGTENQLVRRMRRLLHAEGWEEMTQAAVERQWAVATQSD